MALMVGMAAGRRQAEAAQQQAAQQQAAQEQAYQQGKQDSAPAPSGGKDVTAELQKLAELHKSGVLTDQEFAAAKKKLLA
jgi:type II secretory pathway pseudopilin PulG